MFPGARSIGTSVESIHRRSTSNPSTCLDKYPRAIRLRQNPSTTMCLLVACRLHTVVPCSSESKKPLMVMAFWCYNTPVSRLGFAVSPLMEVYMKTALFVAEQKPSASREDVDDWRNFVKNVKDTLAGLSGVSMMNEGVYLCKLSSGPLNSTLAIFSLDAISSRTTAIAAFLVSMKTLPFRSNRIPRRRVRISRE